MPTESIPIPNSVNSAFESQTGEVEEPSGTHRDKGKARTDANADEQEVDLDDEDCGDANLLASPFTNTRDAQNLNSAMADDNDNENHLDMSNEHNSDASIDGDEDAMGYLTDPATDRPDSENPDEDALDNEDALDDEDFDEDDAEDFAEGGLSNAELMSEAPMQPMSEAPRQPIRRKLPPLGSRDIAESKDLLKKVRIISRHAIIMQALSSVYFNLDGLHCEETSVLSLGSKHLQSRMHACATPVCPTPASC